MSLGSYFIKKGDIFMNNIAELLFEDEELDIDELEESVDLKTMRKGYFVKRRKARQRTTKKQELSEIAKKRKKARERSQLGSSILTFRKSERRRLKEKRKNA